MNRYRAFNIILILIFQCIVSFSYAANGEVLVKGRVFDQYSGDSLFIHLEFRAPDGTKQLVKPDSLTGLWEVKLHPETEYQVIFDNPDIVHEEKLFKAPKPDSNADISLDFTVKRFHPGLELFKYDLFPANSSELSAKAKDELFNIGEFLRINKFVDIEIVVSAGDSYSLPPAPPEILQKKKTGKKYKKEMPVEAPPYDTLAVQTLVDARVIALKNYIESEMTFKDRITVIPDYGLKEENISAMPAESKLRVK